MNAKEQNRFYLLWTVAILLCTVLAVVVLLYCSFSEAEAPSPQPTGSVPYTELTEP